MFLQVQLQFWNSHGFVANFDVIMLFCPQPDDWILSRLGVAIQETCSYSTCFGKWPIHCAYIVFKLCDIRRFDSTVVINVLINMSCLSLNNQILQKFEVFCMNMLPSLKQRLRVNYVANSVTASWKVTQVSGWSTSPQCKASRRFVSWNWK